MNYDDNCNFQKVIKNGAILQIDFCAKNSLNRSRDN